MRLGTRGSALALAQATLVAELLEASAAVGRGAAAPAARAAAGPVARPGAAVEIVPILTRGDREAGGRASEDKSRWVSELESALTDGRIDVAVHSAKDVPGELGAGLELVAAPPRAAAEDVLCGTASLDALPGGARVGTSSVRRIAQLRAARDDVEPVAMQGNVDTRLRKLARGELDAIVLARAGLQRLGREREGGAALDPTRFVPAPGQGTLALQARVGDEAVRNALTAIGDAGALACLAAERAFARELGASCNTPVGAWASAEGGRRLRLRAWIGLPDGSEWIADELGGERRDPAALGRALAERMRSVGAAEMLARAEQAGAAA
jgi:hydroxymethylbilane synthase